MSYMDFEQKYQKDPVMNRVNGEILHICNYCDFASVQAGDLRARVKTHNRRNDKYATNVTLHLFKQAM